MHSADDIQTLVCGLSRYLRANPLACDTCEGIKRWWLDTTPAVADSRLLIALDWMVKQGLMERLVAADGRVRYRRTARADADALLRLLADEQAVARR